MSIQGINADGIGQTTVQNITTSYNTQGSDVNVAFYLDTSITGSGLLEAFVPKAFNFSGWAVGASTSGSNNAIMSGMFYYRNTGNARTNITGFTLPSGVNFRSSGTPFIPIPSMSRIGIDITSYLSGVRGLSIAAFGY